MARARLAWGSVALAFVLSLVGAASAGAQERVYNPGFEFNCGLGLQNWVPTGGASAACDPLAHTGSQSLALTGQGAGQTLQGDCITGAGSGSYAGSFWYRNTNAAVSRVAMSVSFYSSLDCSGSAISTPVPIETTSALNDTSWHQVTGAVLAFPGSKSARINLFQSCTSACAAQTVRYDDLSVGAEAGGGGSGPTVLYDQYNNAAAGFTTTSQDYEAAADSFDSFGADDFVVPGGASWSITGVGVDGEYANGPGPADSVNVLFYANGGGNLPGTLVVSRTAQAYVQGPTAGDFIVTISPAVTLNAGIYWISVRARQDYGCCGGWFWQNRSVQSNSGAAWQNPANGWGTGCTAWALRTSCLTGGGGHPDQVFRLLGTSGTPTAIALVSFTARATSAGIIVSWRTAAEVSTLGFNVYRQSRGKLVKLNQVLIPSVFSGTATGHAYSWLDRKAPKGAARYRLQAVSLDGTRTWSGSAVVAS